MHKLQVCFKFLNNHTFSSQKKKKKKRGAIHLITHKISIHPNESLFFFLVNVKILFHKEKKYQSKRLIHEKQTSTKNIQKTYTIR